jgi:hypothetical protein
MMAIEEIRLGQRVWTPDGQAGSTCVNAETWKRYDVRLLDEESGRDAFDISVLVPPGWLEQRSRKDGQEVWLEFDELDAVGWAQVVRESACPPVAAGPGRVVTATITHASEDVRSLTLSSGEKLGVTGNHRIYSATRQDWIPAKGLKHGEELRTPEGRAFVAGQTRQEGRYRVYNLEVEVEHCFHAGATRVLVHNTCSSPVPGEDLYVGTYSKSSYHNKKTGLNETHTPHHMVADAVGGKSHGKGVSINMRKDLHEQTRTYKRNPDLGDNRKNLAADVRDVRNILKNAGYKTSTVNQQMKEVVRQNKNAGNIKPNKRTGR